VPRFSAVHALGGVHGDVFTSFPGIGKRKLKALQAAHIRAQAKTRSCGTLGPDAESFGDSRRLL